MSFHEPDDSAAGIPLEAHVAELRRRSKANARLYGGSTYFQEEFDIFREYVYEQGCFVTHPPKSLSRPPDDQGNEHQVWFDEPTASFYKRTWPDFFGLLVMQRPDEDDRASPIDYLERWHLHNKFFGDDIVFVGVVEAEGNLQMLIRQPAIAGKPATLKQISEFFTRNGWSRFKIGNDIAFLDPVNMVAISDTHRGNLILMTDGLLAPIDLRIQPLEGVLLEQAQRLCEIAASRALLPEDTQKTSRLDS